MKKNQAQLDFRDKKSYIRLIRLLYFIFMFFSATGGFPLDPNKAITQYMHDIWTSDQGLPVNTVEAIVQTNDGYIWIGTQEGLARFDGVRFTVFNNLNTREIKSNNLWALCEDNEGALWIGSYNDGLICLKHGKFIKYTTENGLSSNMINCIYEDRKGDIWIGTVGGGLNHFKNGEFTWYTTRDGLCNNTINAIHEDSRGNLFFGTGKGLNYFKDGSFTSYTTKEGLSNNFVYSIYEDRKGKLWIGTRQGLNLLNDGRFYVYTEADGLSNDFIRCMYEDRDGNFWIGTYGGGLNRFKEGTFTCLTSEDDLSSNIIRCIYEDNEGNLWIGTHGGGLNRLRDGKFTCFTTKEGLSGDSIWPIYENRKGELWIGTYGNGLNCYKEGKFSIYSTKDGLSGNDVNSLFEDSDGNLWIAIVGAGLNRLKEGKFTYFTIKDGLPHNMVHCLYEDRSRNLWIGTSDGLCCFKEKKFVTFTTEDGLSSNFVRCIYESQDGSLWIGTPKGLNRFKKGKFKSYTTKDNLSNDFVLSLYEDSSRNLWVGTYGGGLNLFKDETFTNYTTKQGLYNDMVLQILEDANGYLWMSCSKGIFQANKKELIDFANGKVNRVHCKAYGKADGMLDHDCHGGFQPAGWKSRDGRLWFPTVKGVVVIDPQHIKVNRLPPPVMIEKILLDGKRIAFSSGLTIPSNVKKVEIHYTCLSFSAPERNKYKYRLMGFDEEWISPVDREDRIVSYMNLPSGEYIFKIIASNNDGIWNEEGSSVTFTVLPHFWMTWWFILLSVIFFSFFSYYSITLLKRFIKILDFWRRKIHIGKYRIIEQIGSGGMAKIYKASSKKMNREHEVAIKLMRDEFLLNPVQRARFLSEGKIVDNLKHPHIVEVFERGEHNGNLFIVMELLKGHTLAQQIAHEGAMDINGSMDIMAQLIDAISVIHQAGIVHRDLKPENIMLVKKGKIETFVKVLDFGLAKTQALTRVTETGMVVGSINYISPEQLLNSEYSTKSDIYSLGVIFYEMVTGEKPYIGESALEIMQEIIKCRVRKPKEIRDDIPDKLNSLILNMIARDPDIRPPVEVLKINLRKIRNMLS